MSWRSVKIKVPKKLLDSRLQGVWDNSIADLGLLGGYSAFSLKQ